MIVIAHHFAATFRGAKSEISLHCSGWFRRSHTVRTAECDAKYGFAGRPWQPIADVTMAYHRAAIKVDGLGIHRSRREERSWAVEKRSDVTIVRGTLSNVDQRA